MSKVEKFNWTLFGTFMFGVIGLVIYNLISIGIK
jgi:hypothetical protein